MAFCLHSKHNLQRLQMLRAEFESVIALIQHFLGNGLLLEDSTSRSGDKERNSEVVGLEEREHSGDGVEGRRENTAQTMKKERMVTFNVPPVSCTS